MEDELGKLRIEKLYWDAQRLGMKREIEVLKDNLRDLSVTNETQLKAIKRYDNAVAHNRDVEGKLDELRRRFDVERGEMKAELECCRSQNGILESEMAVLEDCEERLIVKEDELEVITSRNRDLVSEIAKLGGLKEELGFKSMEKDAEIDGMRKKYGELEAELERLKEELGFKLREKDAEIDDMRKKCDGFEAEFGGLKEELGFKMREKDAEIDDLRKKCDDFEAELSRRKDGNSGEQVKRMEVLRSQILEITSKKNKKIEELEKEKAGLERENREIMEKYKIMEERVVELENGFTRSVIGKNISEIVNALGEEGFAVNEEVKIKIDLNSEKDPGVVTVAKDISCSLKTVIKTEIIGHSEDEHSETDCCTQNSQSPVFIQISDSDNEEVSSHVNDHKRARASPTNQKQGDDSLNPKVKINKLEHVVSESAKHEQPPIAASDFNSNDKFSTVEKKTMPIIIRRCKESLNRKEQAEGLEGSCKGSSRRKESDILKYLGKCLQIEGNYVFDRDGDMIVACKNDPVLCAKAILALDKKGLLRSGQRGFKKCDIDWGPALAVDLVNCDLNTMSADELKQCDPEALDICQKLVREYSRELFQIFKSNEDPFFSHMSTSKKQ